MKFSPPSEGAREYLKGLGLGGETSQQSQVSLSKAEVVGLRLLCVDTSIIHLILNPKV